MGSESMSSRAGSTFFIHFIETMAVPLVLSATEFSRAALSGDEAIGARGRLRM
jgi:hypothetical protein